MAQVKVLPSSQAKEKPMAINRVLILVLDGVGMGALPDAAQYGDTGSHTLRHISEKMGGLNLPTLEKLGLGKIDSIPGVSSTAETVGSYGKQLEASPGKDTSTGHWEMVGIHLKKPFPTFMNGFPKELTSAFIQKTGVKNILGNKAASGTEIIKELGEEHVKTKYPIVYTSADSVFQIACHEEVFPLKELYRLCETARKLCDPYGIGRVIARPFLGKNAKDFKRTPNRKDYVYELPEKMLLDFLKEKQVPVISVGKISDIYNHQGIETSLKTKSNLEGLLTSVTEMKKLKRGLVFTNLIDFDQLYGHRNDVPGFASALLELDQKLPEIMKTVGSDGLLMITSDHGNDPTHPGTDHTREYAPLLAYSPAFKSKNLGVRKTFSDIGQTVAEIFNLVPLKHGTSFLKELSS